MANTDWSEDVLGFWFEELDPEDWFSVKPETDTAIRIRFGGIHDELNQRIPAAALLRPDAALAAIIVLDQFSRNMYRKTAKAFACDALALALARSALAGGLDEGLETARRRFLYMPFMHSEHLPDQQRCVELFETLDGESLKFAVEHRDIVARFGRFPHRNGALGRAPTAEEKAFLTEHEGFGQ